MITLALMTRVEGENMKVFALSTKGRFCVKLLFAFSLAASGFAETHRFEPNEFHNTFSSAHTPVLRIKAGDHVVTFTIDARGADSAGVQRGQGPNPQTG